MFYNIRRVVPTSRLINPAKPEIGKISKQILEKIVRETVRAANVNLWRNTQSVITWFNNIKNKQNALFISFDIVDFYPSNSENLLNEAIDFATQYVNISRHDRHIIMQAKKTII